MAQDIDLHKPGAVGMALLVFLCLCCSGIESLNAGVERSEKSGLASWRSLFATETLSLSLFAAEEESLEVLLDTTRAQESPLREEETSPSLVPPLQPPSTVETPLLEKDPTGALLRSLAFPGWGQIYTKNYLRGAIYGIGEIIFVGAIYNFWSLTNEHRENFELAQEFNSGALLHTSGVTVLPRDRQFQLPDIPSEQQEFDLYQRFQDKRNFYLWITAAWVFVSMFDAYVCAHLYNFDKLSRGEFATDFGIEDWEAGRTCRLIITKRF